MDQNLEDIDSLSVNYFAMGGPVGQMPAAQPIAFDGPLNMADGGLVDINSLSVAAFAEGGEVKEEAAYTEQEIDRMRAAMAQSQADKGSKSPTQQAVKRIIPKSTAQGPQQKSSLARQQFYALPPYPLDMTGKLGQAGPIRRQDGSPPEGEIAQQMTVGTAPGIMAQASEEPGIIRAKEINQPATRSAQAMRAYLQASIPDLKIVEDPYLAGTGTRGQVDTAVPNVIMISPTEKNMGREAVLLHEAEHSRVGKAVQGMPPRERLDNDVRFDKLYGDKGSTRSRVVRNFVANKDKIEKFFGVNIPDVYFDQMMYKNQSRFGSADALFEEQIATLSALEQLTNKSITKGMPELFPDDKAAAIYDAITGLRQTRLDARDLPPFTPQYKSRIDWIKEKLRMRANGSPEYGEIAEQMTVGTPLPTDQGPSLASQGLNLLKQAGQTVYGNLREAVTDPVAFNKRALGNVAQQLQSDPQEFIMNWTGGGLGGIIRPKGGGNLLAGDVEKAIEPLRPKTAGGQEPGKALKELDELFKKLDDLLLKPDAAQRISRRIEESREITKPIAALDDWITSKFSNYVKKQMGTEDDPVRKLADEMSAKVQADYQAGLKRIAKMKDDIATAKARGKNTEASETALADEIEKVDEAFQSTSMLPVQLGPYTHVNASIGRAREKAGMSPFETAKSNLGKSYEELADAPFAPTTKKEIDARIKTAETMGGSWAPDAPKLAENPWLAKLGEEDLVYRIRPLEINEKEIFIHTIDELRNALNPSSGLPPNLLLKPEDMQGLGIEKAFRHVNNINDWRAQQRVAANLADAQRSATTIKEYPDTPKKLKWQQLKPAEYTELPPGYSLSSSFEGPTLFGPDGKRITTFYGDQNQTMSEALGFLSKNDLEKALKYEGSTMRHCVGGYCDSVWSGETNIFSLRDKKGEPHVTIETAPADIRRDGNTPLDFILENPSMADRIGGIKKGRTETLSVETSRNIIRMPEFQEWLRTRPSEILQIKGKGNGKPKEAYIPFIQDFINSQQWSHIGDIQNADFVPLKLSMMDSLRKKGIKVDISFSDANAQPYITKQEFNRLADELGGVNKYD